LSKKIYAISQYKIQKVSYRKFNPYYFLKVFYGESASFAYKIQMTPRRDLHPTHLLLKTHLGAAMGGAPCMIIPSPG
jgi:hypothetical protein